MSTTNALTVLLRRRRIDVHAHSMRQAAEHLGISRQTYHLWESGRSVPSDSHVARIAGYLDLPPERVDELRYQVTP